VDLNRVRVDIAACYPGADGTVLRAFAAAGAHGIVLQATGAGNANPAICDTVAELTGHDDVEAVRAAFTGYVKPSNPPCD
jgi:L-asparaginase